MKARGLFLVLAVCLISLLCLAPAFAADEGFIEVTTPSGPVRGILQDGISIYKGIPYAAPPERFAPPEDVIPWNETLDCTEFGPVAIQTRGAETQPMSEDCLTLNIWTPAKSADEKLPVYVWIHGGGFAQGAGSDAFYEGTAFAKDGIVFISINYRLNALGFFASQETYDQYGTTGNWGFLDQIKALEWVQQNVEAFGGDPDQITVGGESAGSYSTSMLVQSPLAKGLFRRAIMESGSMLGTPGNTQYTLGKLERTIEVGRMMAYTFGADDSPEGLAKLRAADADVFAQMCPLTLDFTAIPAFMITPVFDGYVLPENIYDGLVAGNVNDVDLLWGFNANEGSMFIPAGKTPKQYQALASKMFGFDNAAAILSRFPVDAEHDATARCRQILSHGMFSTVMKPYGDALAKKGNNVYAYYFTYVSAQNAATGVGATHASEIAYAFGNLPQDATEEEKALSAEMHARFVNFIKTGNPNNGALPTAVEWPAYDAESPKVLVLDTELSAMEMPGLSDMEFMGNIMFGEGGCFF